jgi:hypothetical protein
MGLFSFHLDHEQLKDGTIKSNTKSRVLLFNHYSRVFISFLKIKLRDSSCMTLSSLSYMWYLWILTKAMNDDVPSFCTKAYVELMGICKCTKEHTYNTYIVKSNLGSKESWVIQSNQDVHVCRVMEIYMVAILILLCSLKTYLSFET